MVGSFLCSLPRPRLRHQGGPSPRMQEDARARRPARDSASAAPRATRQRPARRHHVLFRLLRSREMRGDLRAHTLSRTPARACAAALRQHARHRGHAGGRACAAALRQHARHRGHAASGATHRALRLRPHSAAGLPRQSERGQGGEQRSQRAASNSSRRTGQSWVALAPFVAARCSST